MTHRIFEVICMIQMVTLACCTDLNTSKSSLTKRQQSHSYVAFSAGLTKTLDLKNTTTVLKLDRVFVNLGLGYDKNTGIFTCPYSGLYNFVFHAVTQTDQMMQIDLYKNQTYIVTGYTHLTNDYGSSANSVVLPLHTTDQVYLKARVDSYLYGLPDEVYTTFSGFLLYNG